MRSFKLLSIALLVALLLSSCAQNKKQSYSEYISEEYSQSKEADTIVEIEWERLRSAWSAYDQNMSILEEVENISESCRQIICRELFVQYTVGTIGNEQIDLIVETPESSNAPIKLILVGGDSVCFLIDNPNSNYCGMVAAWKTGERGDELLFSALPD